MSYEMLHGDCLTELPKLIERGVRVSLVNADIPYFKVKADEWDRQWKDEAAFLAWVGEVCGLISQVMQPNGSLYLYASPVMAARVECKVAEYFNILNSVVWAKPTWGESHTPGRTSKESLRAFFPWTERIIFADQYGDRYADAERVLHKKVYEPIGHFLTERREAAGLRRHEVDTACAPTRKPTGLCYRWEEGACLPTPEQFITFLRPCGDMRVPEAMQADYDALRVESGVLRSRFEQERARFANMRRPFNVSADVQYTDVWTFSVVGDYPGKHPCEKPYAMMEHIVWASSREGDLTLDLCAGSGVFGEAALANGRDVIAIERDAHWARKAANRAGRVRGQRVNLPTPPRNPIDTPLFNTESAA